MSRTINDLRELLFAAMEDLKKGKIDVDQAKQMANLGQVIVNSAVAETRHLKDQGGAGTGFIQDETPIRKITARATTKSEHEKVIAKYADA
jgi:hypothetical protein